MLIGEDFPKIAFEFAGLELLEPNSFIGDTLIFIVALVLAYKTKRFGITHTFFQSWRLFFLTFGTGFFLGGFGHLLYNYWGIPGKTPSWFLGILAVFFIERAMISIHPNEKTKKTLSIVSKVKLVLAIIAAISVSLFVDLAADYSKGMIVPTLNSTIGLVGSLGVLGAFYARKVASFKYLWISVLILIPAAVFQSMKINFHQWYDKNDVGHTLLIIGLFLYFAAIKGYAHFLNKGSNA